VSVQPQAEPPGSRVGTRTAARRQRPLVIHVAAVEYTAQVLLLPQLRYLSSAGYDVRLACAPDGPRFMTEFEPFNPVPLTFPRSPRPLALVKALGAFVKTMRALQPDLVHLHTPAAALPTRLLPRWVLPERTRLVYTVHGFAHVWDSGTRRDRGLELLERKLSSRTDALLFQSSEDLQQTQERGYRSRLIYLGNGVEDDWFDIDPPVRRAGPLKALFVGRLVREKGILDLFDALQHAPDVHLTVCGAELASDRDGVESQLRSQASMAPLSGRVNFTGFLGRAAMRKQVESADVLVLPSYREGVPRSLIEGMAAGRPAVATDVRGCRELVTDGQTGWLVKPGDPAGLAEGLNRAAAAPPTEFAQRSSAARALADARYRETAVFQRLLDTYRDLGVDV
jgi:glycosyltransferase involved in cell wall biosynthesis